jgi:hypothetical protein
VVWQNTVQESDLRRIRITVDGKQVQIGQIPPALEEELTEIGDQVLAFVGGRGTPMKFTHVGNDCWVAGHDTQPTGVKTGNFTITARWRDLGVIEVLNRRNTPEEKQPSELVTLGIGATARIFCSACGESTLQVKIRPNGTAVWMCQDCLRKQLPEAFDEEDLSEVFSHGASEQQLEDV